MRILFVHQNFPGQYMHLAKALAKEKVHHLVSLSIEEPEYCIPGITQIRYGIHRGNQPGIHPWLIDLETKVIRGEACATAAMKLKKEGFTPDLICAHPGWGEMLFLRDIWKSSPILSYQEFFYNVNGFDFDFDQEFQPEPTWMDAARIRIKQVNQKVNLDLSNWCVTPTQFQRSSFPRESRSKISVIHDGIDTKLLRPARTKDDFRLSDSTVLSSNSSVITFVNRRLEPYRGFHTFSRAIPAIQNGFPDTHIVIIGRTKGVSYGSACPNGEWKDYFLSRIRGEYDESRVHFTEAIPHSDFVRLMQRSDVHVYLTYPFVLSWSLLEAMACECAIVGSKTGPVMELIRHEENGLLVDFFNPDELANAVIRLLKDKKTAAEFGRKARQDIKSQYELEKCLSRHMSLISLVASGAVNALSQ